MRGGSFSRSLKLTSLVIFAKIFMILKLKKKLSLPCMDFELS